MCHFIEILYYFLQHNMLFQVMNKNAIEKQLSQEKSQVLRNNFESCFDFFLKSVTHNRIICSWS